MKKGKLVLLIVLAFVAFACAFLIFSSSALSSDMSHAISKKVAELIVPYVNSGHDWQDRAIADNIVRKCAHFAEYFALSCLFFCFALCFGKKTKKILCAVFAALLLLIPVTDEALQLLSDRTSSPLDIGIDLAGAAAGALIVFGVSAMLKKLKNKQ